MIYAEPEQIYVSGPTSGHTAVTLTDLGRTLAPGIEGLLAEAGQLAQGGGPVSFERIGEIDADIVFLQARSRTSDAVDAIVAATALGRRALVVVTSDPDDIGPLFGDSGERPGLLVV